MHMMTMLSLNMLFPSALVQVQYKDKISRIALVCVSSLNTAVFGTDFGCKTRDLGILDTAY